MLSKLFEFLYVKVYVSIVLDRANTHIYIEKVSKKNVLDRIEQSFNSTSLNNKIFEFITNYTKETPFHYISILDTSPLQGAIPSCFEKDMSLFYDLQTSKYRCYADKWSYFTSSIDLIALQKQYSQVGLDFVFSPFVILTKFFKDKINTHTAMFILLEDNYISLCVFDHSELLYAQHIDIQHKDESEDLEIYDDTEEVDFDFEGGIDIDDMGAMDELGGLDDFGDIEDLDSLEDMEFFSDEPVIVKKDAKKDAKKEEGQAGDAFTLSEDYDKFTLIQKSVNTFYKDSKYKSKFVESVYIADSIGGSRGDLKKFLEEEMFLNVYMRQINLGIEICELAKAELQ